MVIKRVALPQALSLADAVDAALGLPADPTTRGQLCPPAPFGRTTQWSNVYQRSSDLAYVIDVPPAAIDGVQVNVGGTPITVSIAEAENDDGSPRVIIPRS